jgi:biopolymer transport protein ExbD
MSTINITPFTDVLLVLLIIFIILAAVTKEPKLPEAHNKDLVIPSQIVVTISSKNEITIGSNQVEVAGASAAFTALQDSTDHAFKSVIIKANPLTTYGTVIRVMDAARAVGLVDFGLANHVQGTPDNSAGQ